jgi:4-hydroxy-3-polyprenylbenzoate decarboxylase
MRVVVGITGASGAQYAVSLIENLKKSGANVALIVSEHGEQLIGFETQMSPDDVKNLADDVYENDDLAADIASGSNRFDALIIVPCSMSTLSKIACGIGDNLITRVASICLKEGRKLVLVPRETPISAIHLENMHKLALLDAVMLPAMPGFYHRPRELEDVINFIVGKIMEQLGLEHGLYDSWKTDSTEKSG